MPKYKAVYDSIIRSLLLTHPSLNQELEYYRNLSCRGWKNERYFLHPEWVKEQVIDLKEFERAIMYFSVRRFPKPESYEELLNKIVRFVTKRT
jgi:hypothetical protein